MPELPILGEDGRLFPLAPITILGFATYPKDKKARAQLIADLLVRLEKSSAGDFSGLAFLVPTLQRSPGTDEVMRRAGKAREAAHFASSVLQVMLSASESHPDLEMNASIAAWGLGKVAHAASDRTHWRHWGAYKSVAHIWLAIETMRERYPDMPAVTLIFEHLQDVLDLSESIRRYAEKIRIFKRGTAWKVPEAVSTSVVPIPTGILTDNFLASLATYKPTNSSKV